MSEEKDMSQQLYPIAVRAVLYLSSFNPLPYGCYIRALIAVISVLSVFLLEAGAAYPTVNIPLDNMVYLELERLEIKGLAGGAILTTRPFGKFEGARLIEQAGEDLRLMPAGYRATSAGVIINRLKQRFAKELTYSAGNRGFSLKPFDTVHLKTFYSENMPYHMVVNRDGYSPGRGASAIFGFNSEAYFFDALSLYLNPELRSNNENSRGRVLKGYVSLSLGGAVLQLGRDSMWWGAGYHGALIMTSNAQPLNMVKLNSEHPFLLPSIFRVVGPFKPTLFLARLEQNRDYPNANLLGLRFDMKPTPTFQVGFSRVLMFGGEGRKSLTFSDWVKVFIASDSTEHAASPINGNQLASIDMSYVYVNNWWAVPFSGIKVYTEWGAEDSSGDSKTPTGKANIYGTYIDSPMWLENFDIRVEWANTARNERYGPLWYKHGIYTSGYTHRGRIIGHHIGADSKDLFIRVQRHIANATFGIETDFERGRIHRSRLPKSDFAGIDAKYMMDLVTVNAGVSGERITDVTGTMKNLSGWMSILVGF